MPSLYVKSMCLETNLIITGNKASLRTKSIIDDKHLVVTLQDDAWAVAPGQPVVFYLGNRLIGGAVYSIYSASQTPK